MSDYAESPIWYGLSIGAVIGGGAGDDVPSGNTNGDDGGIGGAKNTKDKEGSGGAQGLFSLWGHEVWLYIGGVLGIGRTAGLYFTTGPMIGSNPDWAVGGGIHIGRVFGLGMVVPIRQALASYQKHQDKVGMIFEQGGDYLAQLATSAHTFSGLEQVVSTITPYLT